MKKFCSFLFLVFIGTVLLACAPQLKQKDSRIPSATFKLLIASNGTEFKNSIHDRIVERYKDQGNIDNTNIGKLDKFSSDEYDAIVIMDSCMAWSGFNQSIKRYIDGMQNKEKLVLFMTAGDPDWQYSYKKVDAITSASATENEDKIFTLITMQINQILSVK